MKQAKFRRPRAAVMTPVATPKTSAPASATTRAAIPAPAPITITVSAAPAPRARATGAAALISAAVAWLKGAFGALAATS